MAWNNLLQPSFLFARCTCGVVCSQTLASDQTSHPAENPVGKLQEITQKKYIAPPTYEFRDNGCPPHEREYSCTVTLLQYSNTGSLKLTLLQTFFMV